MLPEHPAPHRLTAPALLAALALLAGCSAPRPPGPPALDLPAQFKHAGTDTGASAADQVPGVPSTWWALFKDPVLDALQAQLAQSNPSLAASAAAVRIAQAAVGSSRASLFPTVNLGASATRAVATPGAAATTTLGTQASLAAWEIDLWGRIAANVDAADARFQASRYTLAATRLSLQASLAQTYFALRSSEAVAQLLDQTLEAYATSLRLTENRYQAGVASAADVAQAQTQLQSTRAQRLEVQLQRQQLENALATLVGKAPAGFQLSTQQAGQVPPPPSVPSQLPAQLLARRPDIAAAAAQVQAAAAQVGAAQAAFLPAVTLTASGGFRNSALGGLLSSGQSVWSLAPSLAWAVFDGGARQAARDSAGASYEQAVASYTQTVLAALQEVEDNLVAATLLQQEMAVLQSATASARRALEIAQNQYRAGTVSYLNVVTAQASALSAERSYLDARNRQLAAVNQLLKNLAGPWEGAGTGDTSRPEAS